MFSVNTQYWPPVIENKDGSTTRVSELPEYYRSQQLIFMKD
jgi:hypothetical protein